MTVWELFRTYLAAPKVPWLRPPPTGSPVARHPFAFLVHPRADVRLDLQRAWAPLSVVPERVLTRAMKFPLPPMYMGGTTYADDPGREAGCVMMLPIGAEQMLTFDRTFVVERIKVALGALAARGVRTATLGALTSPVSRGGRLVAGRPDISVTTGNAFTAAVTMQAIERLLPWTPSSDPHVAIVGATGSVGSCVVRLLAERQTVSRMTLVARTKTDTERLAAEVGGRGLEVETGQTLDAAREADLVVLLTSAPRTILGSEHLKEGAVVLDDTQPRNTSPDLLRERPDVTVVDGGVVRMTDDVDIRADVGLPPGAAYACMAEAMLLGLEGHEGDFSLGSPTTEQARYTLELAYKHRRFGFDLADPFSFCRSMGVSWDAPRPAVRLDVVPQPLEPAEKPVRSRRFVRQAARAFSR
jgi:fatty aldehyde-generating acyl-ACP reductase